MALKLNYVEFLPDVIGVEAPQGTVGFDVDFGGRALICLGEYVDAGYIPLPPGNWTFLFCTGEATEEQAAQIVKERRPFFGRVKRYVDYEYSESAFTSAKESLQSLLDSKGLKGNWAILKKIN